MKIFTFPYQCSVQEYGSSATPILTTFPQGNKVKYYGEWFFFQEKFFNQKTTMIFKSKSGRQLIYTSLPKYIEI